MTQTVVQPEITHYGFRVSWSAEDGEFVATCVELPSLSWLAESQEEALQGLRVQVADVVADLVAAGEEVPAPFAERAFSGKLQLGSGPICTARSPRRHRSRPQPQCLRGAQIRQPVKPAQTSTLSSVETYEI